MGSLPGCPAVYLLTDAGGAPVQLASTQHLRRLALSRLVDADTPKRGKTDLAAIVRGLRWRPVCAPFEARWWYYRLARQLHPSGYRRLVSFGPSWFLNVDWTRHVPEIRVTQRVWCEPGECVGSWATRRECQQALEGLWDLFDLCRYPEQVRKAPAGQRCAYAEMGRCDAPCDGSAPLDDYSARSRAAWRFVCGAIDEWTAAAETRMKAQAANRSYERAGQIKQQIAFARRWREKWSPRLRRADELNCLLAVPVTRRRAWKLFAFRRGELRAGPMLSDRKLPVEGPRWLAAQVERPIAELDDIVRMEQTWLVAHFLRSPESERALTKALPAWTVPGHLEAEWRAELAERRRKGAGLQQPFPENIA